MNPTTAQHQIQRLSESLHHVIVGQHEVIHQVVTAVIADGHVLLEGAPGLAKTTLVRSLAQLLSLSFGRVQCTPDLMPSDVVGTMMLFDDQPGRYQLRFAPGPIFASLILVDEINRTPPAPKVPCSKPCKSIPLPWPGRRIPCPIRLWCWPPRTPSRWKGHIHSPKRNAIVFCITSSCHSPMQLI